MEYLGIGLITAGLTLWATVVPALHRKRRRREMGLGPMLPPHGGEPDEPYLGHRSPDWRRNAPGWSSPRYYDVRRRP